MVNTVANMNDLTRRILELEALHATQLASIKDQTQEILNDLKPSALVKSAFTEIAGNTRLKHNMIDTSLGIGAGFLVRKIFANKSAGLFRRLIGYGLQAITTKLVTKKIPAIRDKIVGS